MNTKVLVAYGFLSLLLVNGFASIAMVLGITGVLFLAVVIAFVIMLVGAINTVLEYEQSKRPLK